MIFNRYVAVYQKVNLHFPVVFPWFSPFSYGFPMVNPMECPSVDPHPLRHGTVAPSDVTAPGHNTAIMAKGGEGTEVGEETLHLG